MLAVVVFCSAVLIWSYVSCVYKFGWLFLLDLLLLLLLLVCGSSTFLFVFSINVLLLLLLLLFLFPFFVCCVGEYVYEFLLSHKRYQHEHHTHDKFVGSSRWKRCTHTINFIVWRLSKSRGIHAKHKTTKNYIQILVPLLLIVMLVKICQLLGVSHIHTHIVHTVSTHSLAIESNINNNNNNDRYEEAREKTKKRQSKQQASSFLVWVV